MKYSVLIALLGVSGAMKIAEQIPALTTAPPSNGTGKATPGHEEIGDLCVRPSGSNPPPTLHCNGTDMAYHVINAALDCDWGCATAEQHAREVAEHPEIAAKFEKTKAEMAARQAAAAANGAPTPPPSKNTTVDYPAAGDDAAGSDSESGSDDEAGTDAAGTAAAGTDAAGSDAAGSDAAGSDAAGSDAAGSDAAGSDAGDSDSESGSDDEADTAATSGPPNKT